AREAARVLGALRPRELDERPAITTEPLHRAAKECARWVRRGLGEELPERALEARPPVARLALRIARRARERCVHGGEQLLGARIAMRRAHRREIDAQPSVPRADVAGGERR